MLHFFRRRPPEPRVVSPEEARGIVEERLADPSLTPLQRGVLMQIGAQCKSVVEPNVLAKHQHEKIRGRS